MISKSPLTILSWDLSRQRDKVSSGRRCVVQVYSHKCPQPAGQWALPLSQCIICSRCPPWLQPWHHTNSPFTTWWHTAHTLAHWWHLSQIQPLLLMGRLQLLQFMCSVVEVWFRLVMALHVLNLMTSLDTFHNSNRCRRSMYAIYQCSWKTKAGRVHISKLQATNIFTKCCKNTPG